MSQGFWARLTSPAPTQDAPPANEAPDQTQPQDDEASNEVSFSELFTIEPPKEGEQPKEDVLPDFGGNPEEVLKTLGNLDMISSVATPELLAKVSAGGEEGTTALMMALNQVARQSMQNSYQIAHRLVQEGIKASKPIISEQVNSTLRTTRVDTAITKADPFFSTPEGRPLMEGVKQMILARFPEASAEEITSKAKSYLDHIRGGSKPATEEPPVDTNNWASFLN